MSACLSVSISPDQYTSDPRNFMHVRLIHCRGLVLGCVLCTYDGKIIMGPMEACRYRCSDRVTSLHRRAQDNAHAASYLLRRPSVLDDGGRRDYRRLHRAVGAGGGACNAPLSMSCFCSVLHLVRF